MPLCLPPRWPLALLAPLAGCAVYMPTVPSTPLLTKGQVQVQAGLRGVTSLEAGAAWAPTRHLLLSAESAFYSAHSSQTTGSGQNSQTTSHDDYHRQLSLGAGYYRAAPSGWYLAALGGVGFAGTLQYDPNLDLFFGSSGGSLYDASYRRYYAQLYAAQPAGRLLHSGFSLRTVYVDYAHLEVNSQPFAPNTRVFFEPTFFIKGGRGPLQVQGSIGLSVPLQASRTAPTGNVTSPTSSLLGVALIFRPDLLKHQP